jgi:nucleotide-binding universal stress UspA family protein
MQTSPMKQMEKTKHIRLQQVVAAVDFSAPARAALAYAAALARQYEAQLRLVHVFPGDLYAVVPPPPESAWVSSMPLRKDAESSLAELQKSPLLAGLEVTTEILEGDAGAALGKLSRRPGVDLMVLGTHGARGVEKFLMGSVAEKTFLTAECPVLTVGPETKGEPEERVAMRTILCATDFSPSAAAALPYALSFAQEQQSTLVLLHVVEKLEGGGFSYDQAMATEKVKPQLEALVPEEAHLWCDSELMVRFGAAPEAILQAAADLNADVIVMGVRGAGVAAGAKTHFAGSTAYKVAREAVCPVLTVRR